MDSNCDMRGNFDYYTNNPRTVGYTSIATAASFFEYGNWGSIDNIRSIMANDYPQHNNLLSRQQKS